MHAVSRGLFVLAAFGATACGASPGTGSATAPPDPAAGTTPLEIGPGDLTAAAASGSTLALCLRNPAPRLVVATLPDGPVADLEWPLAPDAPCERLAVSDTLVCAAGYDAGIACAPLVRGGGAVHPAVGGPPTGLAWDGRAFWVATDGAGLWRFDATGAAAQEVALPETMSGLVSGPFGLVWGTTGDAVWRTRRLPRGTREPQWLRPPLPPNVTCGSEAEVCEWSSTALGWYRGRVWFAVDDAPAPVYSWAPDDGSWRELQVTGEVLVGPSGVFAVHGDGEIEVFAPRRSCFGTLREALGPGEAPVSAAGGLWAVGGGQLRLVVPGDR